ncbi:MAG: hypothetical protein IJF71_03510 [Clostridia bacterium]|nr:hypothetical protein [Clostridia bacterium]
MWYNIGMNKDYVIAFNKGNKELAYELCERAIQSGEEDYSAYCMRGMLRLECLSTQPEPPTEEQLFAIRLDFINGFKGDRQDIARAHYGMIMLLHAMEDFDDCIEQCQKFEQECGNKVCRYFYASSLLRKPDSDENALNQALFLLESYSVKDPDMSFAAELLKVRILAKLRQGERAFAICNRLLKIQPQNEELVWLYGHLCLDFDRNIAPILPTLQKIYEATHGVEFAMLLGEAYCRSGNKEMLSALVEGLPQGFPDDAAAFLRSQLLEVCVEQAEKDEQAEELLQKIEALTEEEVTFERKGYLQARVLIKLKRWEQAVSVYRLLYEKTQNPDYLYQTVLIDIERKAIAEALSTMDELEKILPGTVALLYQRGRALKRASKTREELRQAARCFYQGFISGDYDEACLGEYTHCIDVLDDIPAIEELSVLLKKQKKRLVGWYDLTCVFLYERKKNYQKAIHHCLRAIKKGFGSLRYRLARLLDTQEQTLTYSAQYVRSNIDNPDERRNVAFYLAHGYSKHFPVIEGERALALCEKEREEFPEYTCNLTLLANFYRWGVGCEADEQKAFALYQKAYELIQQQFMSCSCTYARLSMCYEKGIGCERSRAQAVSLVKEAFMRMENGSVGTEAALLYAYYAYEREEGFDAEKALGYLQESQEHYDAEPMVYRLTQAILEKFPEVLSLRERKKRISWAKKGYIHAMKVTEERSKKHFAQYTGLYPLY